MLTRNQEKTLRAASRIQEKIAKEYGALISFVNGSVSKKYFFNRMFGLERECFDVAFLNSQHGLIECETLFTGTIDAAAVYPREIAKRALELNAAAIIIAHNHPSGVSEPSDADRRITVKIRDTLQVLDIRLLDHLVVGVEPYRFAENGIV